MTTNPKPELQNLLTQAQEKALAVHYMLNFLSQLSGDGKNSASITLDDAGVDGFREMLRLLADVSFAAYENAFCAKGLLQEGDDHE